MRGALWMLGEELNVADIVESCVPTETENTRWCRGKALRHVPQQSRPGVLATVRCYGLSLKRAGW